jgi:hypothetical protein
LRYVLNLAPEYHAEVVRQIIDFNLSVKQVKEMCQGDGLHETQVAKDDISPSAMKMAKVAQAINTTTPQEVARALMRQEGDVALARARLQALRKLIGEAERYLVEE